MRQLTRGRIRAAIGLAVLADGVQLGLLPAFAEGFLSPANDSLELAVAIAMLALLGWHWALLPSVIAEMIPAANLFPTWTAAVLFVTRQGPSEALPELPAAGQSGDAAAPPAGSSHGSSSIEPRLR